MYPVEAQSAQKVGVGLVIAALVPTLLTVGLIVGFGGSRYWQDVVVFAASALLAAVCVGGPAHLVLKALNLNSLGAYAFTAAALTALLAFLMILILGGDDLQAGDKDRAETIEFLYAYPALFSPFGAVAGTVFWLWVRPDRPLRAGPDETS